MFSKRKVNDMLTKDIISFEQLGPGLVGDKLMVGPDVLEAGRGRGHVSISSVFAVSFTFPSSFLLFPFFCCLICPFSSFLWETTQNNRQGLAYLKTRTETNRDQLFNPFLLIPDIPSLYKQCRSRSVHLRGD